MKKDTHLTSTEKQKTIQCQVSCNADEAFEIATATEHFTFMMLEDLIKAFKIIAKGK